MKKINFASIVVFTVITVLNIGNAAKAATAMISFSETPEVLNQNVAATFSFSMFNASGTACSNCNYTVITSPVEAVTSTQSGNIITGSFIPTRKGTYSLMVSVTDSNNNTQKNTYPYFIDASTGISKYYFRHIFATHGQVYGPPFGTGTDNGSLLLTPPQETESNSCNIWAQASPDQISPGFPMLSLLSSFTGNMFFYSTEGTSTENGAFGIQRNVTYDGALDLSTNTIVTSVPTENTISFNNIDWNMDSSKSWYSLAAKSDTPNAGWQSTPTDPSYADFTYEYTTTPLLGMANPNAQWNTDIKLLSATASTTDSNSYSITLENTGTQSAPALFTIPDTNRPFLGTLSTIDTNGTTTLNAIVSGNSNLTINNVPLSITPASEPIDVDVMNWNPAGLDYKQWIEIASTTTNVNHSITSLLPSAAYEVRVNNVPYNTYTTDASGSLAFSYTDASSYNQFEVFPSSSSPAYASNIEYWYSATDTDWSNISNWYIDPSHTDAASSSPSQNTIAILTGSTTPNINLDSWTQPAAINAQASGVAMNSTNGEGISINLTGNATFSGSSVNYGTITGNATFSGSSINYGTITGNATFSGSSINYGTITGNATFNDSSYNDGIINGTATFAYASAGTITIPDGGQWGSGTANSIVGSDGEPITLWIFNGASYNDGIINGDATFNGSSENSSRIIGNATFNGSSLNYGTVDDNATFNDESANYKFVTGTATFNDSSFNGGITGTATFNDSSYNNNLVTGNVIFNDNSYNENNAVVEGNATFNDSSYNAVGSVHLGQNIGGGIINGNATFNDSSTNIGIINGNATFINDLSEDFETDSSSSLMRIYTENVSTTRDFTQDAAPWTVVANNASVDITNATYDGNTIFETENGGQFIPAPTNQIDLYAIGGSLTGASGTVILQDNSGDNLSLSTNGSFVFPTLLRGGSNYAITLFSYPNDQICTAANSSGTVTTANITNVIVSCGTKTVTTQGVSGPVISVPYGNGGGGSGGWSYISLAQPTATIDVSSTPSSSTSSTLSATLTSLLAELKMLLTQRNAELIKNFTRDLKMGMRGDDVRVLQEYLNDNGYPVASTGSGSIGNESIYFGEKTVQALKNFQAAHGITATGYFGSKTRAFIDSTD